MATLRIGILGAARIAPSAVIKPARNVGEATIGAVAARDRSRADAFAAKHDIPKVRDSYAALIADTEIDAIYNPLPNGLHAEWTIAALEAGKHVLCEKPFTANTKEAEEVAAVATRTGLVVMEAFHYRYHPLAHRMRDIVDSGELGAIRRVETALCFPLPKFSDIRYQYDLAGGATMDVGTYTVHMARLLGREEPEVVSAEPRLRTADVDRAMRAELKFPGGHTGRITCSMWSKWVIQTYARVIGERGELHVINPTSPQLWHRMRVKVDGTARTEKFSRKPTYEYQLEAFCAAVLRGEPTLTPPADSIANMRVLDAIYVAAGMKPRWHVTPVPPGVDRLGVVVAGTGFGCITHVRALRAAGLDVLALVGRDAGRTRDRADKFGVPLALTSLADALALPGVDAVTIATPPHTHAELALRAIAAGKHVICEKPFARDAAEARGVLAAAEAAGIVHVLGTEFRWDPGQATLARTVRSGAVGEPRLATVVLHVPVLAGPDAEVPEWWADQGRGGGWFGAHGSQVIDQLRVTLGEFSSVSAALPHVGASARTADDAFVVHFETRSGCAGVMQSTAADWGPPVVITRVAGTEGTAWIEGVGSTVNLADRAGTRTVPVGTDLSIGIPEFEPLPPGLLHTAYDRMIAHGFDLGPYTRLAGAFRDLVADRRAGVPPRALDPSPATFADGVAGMEILDAVRRSALEDGARVDVMAGGE